MLSAKNEQVIRDDIDICFYCGHKTSIHAVDLNFKKIRQHGHCDKCNECRNLAGLV